MSTIVTQPEICATTVTQAEYTLSAASSAVSPNDFRRAWITPNPENLSGIAERNSTQNQNDRSAKHVINDDDRLSISHQQLLQPSLPSLSQQLQQQHLQNPQPLQQQQSVDHDDEVALHPLSNQVSIKSSVNFDFI